MAENSKPAVALSDAERFPLLTDLSFLKQLRQDQFAPSFNFQSGDRLKSDQLEKVKEYASAIATRKFQKKESQPDWLKSYIDWCIRTVPFYKGRKTVFDAQPTIRRSDLHAHPWKFVSSDCDLNDLLVYQTSGTTGSAMDVVFDPVSQACWIPQLESVLNKYNIRHSRSNERIAIALICNQESTLTYASLSTYLEGAGVIKINLNSTDWKDPDHRIKFLEKYNPEILTGDPFTFLSLMELKPRISPKALVSSAMKLTEGMQKKLESFFKCPVLDIYSLTECRMIAVADEGNRYRAIRPELFLEVFDPAADIQLRPGERGELVVTGGNNPFLPLIRYRTGDFCSLHFENDVPYLIDLEARKPVALYRKDGSFVNNIEVSRAMMDLPLAGFSLHQSADKSILFTGWSSDKTLDTIVYKNLQQIFGKDCDITVNIKAPEANSTKPVSYTSDFAI